MCLVLFVFLFSNFKWQPTGPADNSKGLQGLSCVFGLKGYKREKQRPQNGFRMVLFKAFGRTIIDFSCNWRAMNETKLHDWAQLVLVQCTSTKENSHNLLDQDFD